MVGVVPCVDFSDFLSTDAARRERFVRAFADTLSEFGVVLLKNHGIPADVIEKLHRVTQSFFALPEVVKRKYVVPGAAGERGFLSSRGEKNGVPRLSDQECFSLGCPPSPADPLTMRYLPNVFPVEVPDARETLVHVYKHFSLIGKYILRALALRLGADESFFDEKVVNADSLLRLIHYPHDSVHAPPGVRHVPHEDIGALTLSWGAKSTGLEVLSSQGEWVPVRSSPEVIVVTCGGLLERVTNGRVKSSTHRVVTPPVSNSSSTSFVVPFFLHFRKDVVVDALPSCVDTAHPKKWQPITADAFLHARLVRSGLCSREEFVEKFGGKWVDELP